MEQICLVLTEVINHIYLPALYGVLDAAMAMMTPSLVEILGRRSVEFVYGSVNILVKFLLFHVLKGPDIQKIIEAPPGTFEGVLQDTDVKKVWRPSGTLQQLMDKIGITTWTGWKIG
jgi:hypothetical protein